MPAYRPDAAGPAHRARRGKNLRDEQVLIGERPARRRIVLCPGSGKVTLSLGPGRSAIGTLVERTMRLRMLLHLPPMPGYGRDSPQAAILGVGTMRPQLTRSEEESSNSK